MNTAEALHPSVSLLSLIEGLPGLPDDLSEEFDRIVTGVNLDSRLIEKGDLFIACFGKNHDAREYIGSVVDMGAAAVLADSGGNWQGARLLNNVPVIAIDNLAGKMSEISNRFYSNPSSKLNVIGITGTNGKTSCSQFIAQALTKLGFRCGVIGTLGYGTYGELNETQLTTPDAVFTQMALAEMVADKVEPVVMEVSSVGLHQKRVAAVRFSTAIFTNITRDHLDYHGSMEEYGANKKKLFTMEGLKHAIVNLDDPFALSIINEIASDVEILTYSLENPVATVSARQLKLTREGFQAEIVTPLGSGVIGGRLLGSFNFSNLLAVAAALISYLSERENFTIETLCGLLSDLSPVNGRMDIVAEAADITAVVDYAHTPDGLRSALVALREHFDSKIWCVFGCGGNRDQGKRPLMGEIAEAYADRLVIADDNPRREQGDAIVQHILSGIQNPSAVTVIRDRAMAIEYAIANAVAGDVILIAGKGHETYQDIDGDRHIFSDANQVRLALQKRQQQTRSGQS